MLLMLITSSEHPERLFEIGARFAAANKWPLQCWICGDGKSETPDFVPPAAFKPSSELGRQLAAPLLALEEAGESVEVSDAAYPLSRPAMTRLVEGLKPRLVLLHHEAKKDATREGSAFSDHLFDHAKVSVMLVQTRSTVSGSCRRILIPTAGGPHGLAGLRLLKGFPLEDTEVISPFYVENDFGDLSRDVGMAILKQLMGKAGLKAGAHVVPRVRLARNFNEGLTAEMKEHRYDLVLIGATGSSRIRRYLFGSIPERVLKEVGGASVAVLRAGDPMLHRLRSRAENLLMLTVPQMKRSDRLSLFEKMETGSKWNFDFMTLMGLSTAIAALGLIQNSAAVVIGAMLVAPLMTPLLGLGLSLVQRNLPLALRALQAVVLGFLFALFIAWIMGLAAPLAALTPELMGRVEPSLLDMGVAFLSGIAAAYCSARPRLSAALPGVAIAAALVPPIATTGISLGMGAYAHATGGALLFGTNVVAIVLGASLSFYFGGIRSGARGKAAQRWATRAVWLLLLSTLALSVPLGSRLLEQFRMTRWHRVTLSSPQQGELKDLLEAWTPPARLTELSIRAGGNDPYANVRLERPVPVSPEETAQVSAWFQDILEKPVRVRLQVDLVSRADLQN